MARALPGVVDTVLSNRDCDIAASALKTRRKRDALT